MVIVDQNTLSMNRTFFGLYNLMFDLKATIVVNEYKNTTSEKRQPTSKMCLVCNRPFDWRKKWEKVWDEVKYCRKNAKETKGLIWFRNDLRVHDNESLFTVENNEA
jgi:hypothetical protein